MLASELWRALGFGFVMGLGVLVLCAENVSHGFLQTRDPQGHLLTWRTPVLSLQISGRPPKGLSRSELVRAAQAAADTWNAVDCAQIRIEIGVALGEEEIITKDAVNRLVVHQIAWCTDERGSDCHSSLNPALTTVRFSRGTIYEADIEINGVDFRWDEFPTANHADLQVVLTHEFGHALGLSDSCRMPGASEARDDRGFQVPDCTALAESARTSVMWPVGAASDQRKLRLSKEDRRAVCALYPRRQLRRSGGAPP